MARILRNSGSSWSRIVVSADGLDVAESGPHRSTEQVQPSPEVTPTTGVDAGRVDVDRRIRLGQPRPAWTDATTLRAIRRDVLCLRSLPARGRCQPRRARRRGPMCGTSRSVGPGEERSRPPRVARSWPEVQYRHASHPIRPVRRRLNRRRARCPSAAPGPGGWAVVVRVSPDEPADADEVEFLPFADHCPVGDQRRDGIRVHHPVRSDISR